MSLSGLQSEPIRVDAPFSDIVVEMLKAGDRLLISGTIYTARDAAHKCMVETLSAGEELPFELLGQTLYYTGPTPTRPGEVVGSAGPTTSGRMDAYTPTLLALGLKGMIGKGYRSAAVIEAMIKNKAIYCGAIGGAGALIARCILTSEVVAYEELGTESIRKLTVKDFPVIVLNDCYGNDWYKMARMNYCETIDEFRSDENLV